MKNKIKGIEEALRKQKWALEERVKELNCLYNISRLFEKREASLNDVLKEAVLMIPEAWQFPVLTQAAISIGSELFTTPDYLETAWMQESPVFADSRKVGAVKVCYMEERPVLFEGPFLYEERQLIDTIAQLAGELVERKWAEEKLVIYKEKLSSMTAALTLGEQRERRQLAESIHDCVGQKLAIVNIRLGSTAELAGDGEIKRSLSEIRGIVGEIISDTRSLTFELCPPVLYELGLGAALGWLVERFGKDTGIVVDFSEKGAPGGIIGEELSVMLFQSARELLMNVFKHAKAQWANLTADWREMEVVVSVEDDGVGIDAGRALELNRDNSGFGLFSIRERLEHLGGRMVIEPCSTGGTKISMVVPLKKNLAMTGERQR